MGLLGVKLLSYLAERLRKLKLLTSVLRSLERTLMLTPLLLLAVGPLLLAGSSAPDATLPARNDQQQVPRAMHTKMKELPRITVGVREGDLRGADNRVLQ